MPRRIGALDRKLLRDLRQMKGQSIAIASIIAVGVTMFVTYLSNFESLQRTRETYYPTARFADVFASLKRAPTSGVAPSRRPEEFPRHHAPTHEPADLSQCDVCRRDCVRCRLQLCSSVVVGTRARPRQLARAGIHAYGDLPDSARRDRMCDDRGPSGRRVDRVRARRSDHGRLLQRNVPQSRTAAAN